MDCEKILELNKVEAEQLPQLVSPQAKVDLRAWACFVCLSSVPVLCFDTAGRIVLANPVARELLRPEGLEGCTLGGVFPELDSNAGLRCIQQGEERTFEQTFGPRTYHFAVKRVPELEIGYIYGNDITARKRSEEALRRAQALLNQTQSLAKIGGWEYDVETRRVTWTEGVYHIYGVDPSAYDPNDVEQDITFYAPEDQARITEAFHYAVEMGEPYDLELEFCNAQGERLWVRTIGRPEQRDGKVIRVFGHIMDVTVHKQREDALARSQRLLLSLSRAAQAVQRARTPEAVYRAIGEQAEALGFDAMVFTLSEDREHLVIAYLTIRSNLRQMAEKLVGLPMEGYRFPLEPGGIYQHVVASGETVFDKVDAARIAEVLPRPVRPLAGQLASLFDWQHRILAPLTIDGEVQGLLAFGAAELTEADVPAVTAFANQTAIALKNARLYQETQQLAVFNHRIIEGIAEGIVVEDTDGVFTFVNPAAAEILGYTPDELIGSHWTTVVPPDQQALVHAADERRMHGESDRYELELVRKDGQRITVLVSGTPRFDAEEYFTGTMSVFTDITARKRAEEAVEFQTLLLNQVPNSVIATDLEGHITYVNVEGARPLERGREALRGKPVTVYGEDPSRGATQQQIIESTLENGEWSGEVVNYAADGTEIIREVRTKLIEDEQGKPWRMIGVGTDITARKRMDEVLRESEEKYRTLFEEALNPIFVVDENARYIDANKAALEFLECDRDELLGKRVWDFAPPGLLARLKQEHAPFVNRRTLETEYLVNETVKTLLLNVVPVEMKGRRILYGIGQDITERKRAEEALRESEEKYRTLFEQLPIPAFTKDRAGAYTSGNAENQKYWAVDPIGQTDAELLDPETAAALRGADLYVMETGDTLTVEEHLAGTPLGERQVLSRKAPLRDSRGNIVGILGVSLDITERKRVGGALRMQAEALERINAELQQLAYAVSHDVAAPLRMIRYGVKKVRQDYKGELAADSDELLGYVVEEAEWMQRLVDDLREYSRVHTRGRPFAPVDCEEVLAQVLRQLALDIECTDAEVTHDPLPTVVADEAQMVQLFQNLISNALKYHGEAPPRVHVEVEESDGEWVFAVQDNGIGIDSQHFERIFGIFERLHTREEYNGTGVGLAVCQRIVQRHGGRIWVASEVGQGSTFYFTLPKEQDSSLRSE